MIKVLHNGNCSKSNAAVDYLVQNNIPFEVIDIINEPLSVLEIKTVLKKLGKDVSYIIRATDKLYTDNFVGQQLSDDAWIEVLSKNPSLIQRPILIKGSSAILGRPFENVKSFVEKA
ncbi:ArsC/Spx/MgsR family protein [Chryseobacterium taiwanense]|uniref:Arsenate reductase n=1 Tax=Chryseobacterium taiwanense TaxID=363331 RepID=A0A0B4DCV8_9FLAO|nr:ArsC/Spx/MgsR family protein [Chryseobacterium taiwanense]KIC62160.1 arsenate reductase [Chryseobacterium taiwanense]